MLCPTISLIFACSLAVFIDAAPTCSFLSGLKKKDFAYYNYGDGAVKNLYCEVSKMQFKDDKEASDKLAEEIQKSKDSTMSSAYSCSTGKTLNCVRINFKIILKV